MEYEDLVDRVHELYSEADVDIEADDEDETVTVYHPSEGTEDWQGALANFDGDEEGIEVTPVGVAGDADSRIVFEPAE